ncbi:uncharacterized protein alkal2b isoform X3 [Gambusia affinis]|uniref:uncharacterized protein alkal2b isoform X3 n=1 Tax=Gambusia affinis TaxID=33528 RepID=UPI001CDC5939|nr:uncharacterized protein alkal2b isoform X3 [Gambusia affinis]
MFMKRTESELIAENESERSSRRSRRWQHHTVGRQMEPNPSAAAETSVWGQGSPFSRRTSLNTQLELERPSQSPELNEECQCGIFSLPPLLRHAAMRHAHGDTHAPPPPPLPHFRDLLELSCACRAEQTQVRFHRGFRF